MAAIARPSRNSRHGASPALVARLACLSSRSVSTDAATTASRSRIKQGSTSGAANTVATGGRFDAAPAVELAPRRCRRAECRIGLENPPQLPGRRFALAALERDARQPEPRVDGERHRRARGCESRRLERDSRTGQHPRARAYTTCHLLDPAALEGQLAEPEPGQSVPRRGLDHLLEGSNGGLIAALVEQQRCQVGPASIATFETGGHRVGGQGLGRPLRRVIGHAPARRRSLPSVPGEPPGRRRQSPRALAPPYLRRAAVTARRPATWRPAIAPPASHATAATAATTPSAPQRHAGSSGVRFGGRRTRGRRRSWPRPAARQGRLRDGADAPA